jgi:hypothetical protein
MSAPAGTCKSRFAASNIDLRSNAQRVRMLRKRTHFGGQGRLTPKPHWVVSRPMSAAATRDALLSRSRHCSRKGLPLGRLPCSPPGCGCLPLCPQNARSGTADLCDSHKQRPSVSLQWGDEGLLLRTSCASAPTALPDCFIHARGATLSSPAGLLLAGVKRLSGRPLGATCFATAACTAGARRSSFARKHTGQLESRPQTGK